MMQVELCDSNIHQKFEMRTHQFKFYKETPLPLLKNSNVLPPDIQNRHKIHISNTQRPKNPTQGSFNFRQADADQ